MKIHEVIALLQRYPGDMEVQIPSLEEAGCYDTVRGIDKIDDQDVVYLIGSIDA